MNTICQHIFLFIGILVTLQMIANYYDLPRPSAGIVWMKNKLAWGFERIGYWVGYYVNLHEWILWIRNILSDLWEFIRRLRNSITDAIVQIFDPLFDLLFSWSHFFVGFARNNYIIFSVIGLGLVLCVVLGILGGYFNIFIIFKQELYSTLFMMFTVSFAFLLTQSGLL